MRWMAVLALLLAVGCSKSTPSSTPVQQADVPSTIAPDAATAAVQSVKIEPQSIPTGGQATAQVTLAGGMPLDVTVSWFGPDGWLIGFETKSVGRGAKNVSFAAPKFAQGPGTYRAEAVVGDGTPATTTFTVS